MSTAKLVIFEEEKILFTISQHFFLFDTNLPLSFLDVLYRVIASMSMMGANCIHFDAVFCVCVGLKKLYFLPSLFK